MAFWTVIQWIVLILTAGSLIRSTFKTDLSKLDDNPDLTPKMKIFVLFGVLFLPLCQVSIIVWMLYLLGFI